MKKTKVDNKRLGIVIGTAVIAIVVIALLVKGGSKNKKDVATDTNGTNNDVTIISSDKLAETKEYKGLEITNVQIKIDDTMTELTADVRNNTSQDMEGQPININVLDKDGNRVTVVGGWIDAVKVGETTPIYASILSNGKDINAYDIEITQKREEATNEQNNESGEQNITQE